MLLGECNSMLFTSSADEVSIQSCGDMDSICTDVSRDGRTPNTSLHTMQIT